MQYYECPNCGASLDPGEICDCAEKQEDNGGDGNGQNVGISTADNLTR